jgi:uncharacterized protein
MRVVDNLAERRYELLDGDELAGQIDYRMRSSSRAFIHTEVEPKRQGLGSELVKGALDDVRARGLRVVPVCPFVRAYIRRHPEYADLVAQTE